MKNSQKMKPVVIMIQTTGKRTQQIFLAVVDTQWILYSEYSFIKTMAQEVKGAILTILLMKSILGCKKKK